MSASLRFALLVPAGLLLLPGPLAAQVKFGEFSSNLNGTVSSGYTADFGNQTSSDHGWTAGGTANLGGFFYNPNFLSYNATLFLNQSRANSEFQSISDSSGVGVSSTIFGGSRFPGAISYSKGYNSDGNYAIPGVANYVTHGNNDDLGLSWSVNLPDAPSFTAGYQMGTNHYSVYGTDDQGQSEFHSLNLRSTYKLDGFNMGAFYTLGGNRSLVPETLSGVAETAVDSTSDGFGFSVSHRLPMQGSASANINRSTWNTNYQDLTTSGTVDTASLFAAVRPAEKLTVSGSVQYSDNLTGQLIQSIISAGAGADVAGLNANMTSNSVDMQAVATYIPTKNTQTTAFVERRTQLFEGIDYGVNSYGGGATYTHPLLNGYFNASTTFSGNTSDNSGSDTLGFSANANYSSVLKDWHLSGSFGYAQNMQTLLVTYLNSSYHFSGNARRRWGRVTFSAGGGGSKTGLTDQPGTTSSSESYDASLGFGSIITTNGSYSKASGQAIATGAGLLPVPVPSPILPSNLVTLYGGDSYAFALSSAPIKGLTLTTSYARSNSDTTNAGLASMNENEQYNALIQYQVRKTGFVSGFARLDQGFSGSGTPPEVISSFYIGLTRWFNFF